MVNWFPGEKDNFWAWTPVVGLGYIVYFENGEPKSYEALTCESAKGKTWRKSQ